MGDGAETASNYAIGQENINSEVGTLGILSATLSADGTAVELKTRSQNEVSYRVSVVDVMDAGGGDA